MSRSLKNITSFFVLVILVLLLGFTVYQNKGVRSNFEGAPNMNNSGENMKSPPTKPDDSNKSDKESQPSMNNGNMQEAMSLPPGETKISLGNLYL